MADLNKLLREAANWIRREDPDDNGTQTYLLSRIDAALATPPTGVEGAPTDDDMDESGDESESDSLEDRLGMAFARLGLLRGKTLLHDSERQELTQARKAIFDALAALAAQPVAGHQGGEHG